MTKVLHRGPAAGAVSAGDAIGIAPFHPTPGRGDRIGLSSTDCYERRPFGSSMTRNGAFAVLEVRDVSGPIPGLGDEQRTGRVQERLGASPEFRKFPPPAQSPICNDESEFSLTLICVMVKIIINKFYV
jgi:hypothetical protein